MEFVQNKFQESEQISPMEPLDIMEDKQSPSKEYLAELGHLQMSKAMRMLNRRLGNHSIGIETLISLNNYPDGLSTNSIIEELRRRGISEVDQYSAIAIKVRISGTVSDLQESFLVGKVPGNKPPRYKLTDMGQNVLASIQDIAASYGKFYYN